VFLEPVLPAPRVLVAGDSPIVAALEALGPEVGLKIVAAHAIKDGVLVPAAGDLALVVAAHGSDELGTLRAGLEAGVRWIGLVASRKRGAAVIDELRADGVADELLDRVETPAGLDIGARTPAEVALSILARIVEVRRSGATSEERSELARRDR
jgi:xanthine dehydrogenase accessory factor